MTLGQSIRNNTLWLLGGDISGKIIAFAVGVVLARLLVPEDFGLLVTINIFTGVASFVASGGMGEALVQAKHVNDEDYKVVFTVQILIGFLIYLGFYNVAPWFSIWFSNELYVDLLRVAALTFILRPFGNMPRAQLKRAMRFKVIAVNRIFGVICASSVSIILALLDRGPWALVLGGLSGATVNILLLYINTRWYPGIYFQKSVVRRLGGYGIKISLNEIILYIRRQTGNLIISHQLGPSLLGLYNKAESLSGLPAQTIGKSIYQPIFRTLSMEQDNIDLSKYLYFRMIELVSVYTMPFYIGLFWLAEPFIITVYGHKWSDSILPLQILAFSGIFRCITYPSGALIAAQNRLGHEIRIQIETWILLIIGCVIGLQWGISGVALGVLPSFVFVALRMSWLANKCIKGNFAKLLQSLMPALLINSALCIILMVTDISFPEMLRTDHPGYYLLSMSGIGAFSYALLFLYAPIPALATESMRWKRKLHLATNR